MLDITYNHDPRIHNYLQFAFYSGLRTSELFELKWEDIDWKKQIAHIQRAVVEQQLKETKTQASNRKIILLPGVLEALKHQKLYSFVGGDFVFVRPMDQGPFVGYKHLERPWKHILKLAGIRYRNPYQTRHNSESLIIPSTILKPHKNTMKFIWLHKACD